uniref:Uncharacterized protein n=1 Tax=Daphnia galeata TaxID=27404 RepID=A0A8J2RNJ8_9CRUS|nr:unnamed protein product [Daphnia galeata]
MPSIMLLNFVIPPSYHQQLLIGVQVDERRHYSTAKVSLLGSNSPAKMDQFLGIARSCLETIGAELWFYNVEKSSADSSSVLIELEYERSLSAGTVAARYYLSKSVKDSSKQQYTRVYDIWTDFCQWNGLPKFGQLAACLSLVMLEDGSYSKVVTLSAATAHKYRFRMLQSQTPHETISLLFCGFRNEHPQTRVPNRL